MNPRVRYLNQLIEDALEDLESAEDAYLIAQRNYEGLLAERETLCDWREQAADDAGIPLHGEL